jgi:hypothetical protein
MGILYIIDITIIIGLRQKSCNEQIPYLSSIVKLWIVLYMSCGAKSVKSVSFRDSILQNQPKY